MNCRTCGYALWNLAARTCPECNTSFVPSQFLFRRHSVAFCCPECDQPYYGTGEGGHLEPRAFKCVKCGRATYEDEMVLRPTEGVVEDRTRYRPVPWLDRDIRSIVMRGLQTVMWMQFLPGQLGRRLPTPERTSAAVGFAALCALVLIVPALVFTVLAGALLGPALIVTGIFASLPLWAFVVMFPWSFVTHMALAISGPRRHGYGRTLACQAYALPTCAPLAVPFLSFYLAPFVMLYWWVMTALILRAGQGVSRTRAFLAAAVFPLVCTLTVAAVVLFVVMPWYRNTMATARATLAPVSTPQQQAQAIFGPLFKHAAANGGAGPTHMSELFLSGEIRAPDLLSGQRYRNDARVSIGQTNMTMIEMMLGGPGSSVAGPTAQTVRADVKALTPAGPITSHRVGDVVFTYHGIDISAPADPGLWLFVITTEPSPYAAVIFTPGGSATPARPKLVLAQADGVAIEVADADFAARLEDQNKLRAKHGLAALPDLRLIPANGFTTPADAPPP